MRLNLSKANYLIEAKRVTKDTYFCRICRRHWTTRKKDLYILV